MSTDSELQSIAKRAARNISIGLVAALALLPIAFGLVLLFGSTRAINPALIMLVAATMVPICCIYPVVQMFTVLRKHRVQRAVLTTVLTLISLVLLPIVAPLVAYFGITKLGKA